MFQIEGASHRVEWRPGLALGPGRSLGDGVLQWAPETEAGQLWTWSEWEVRKGGSRDRFRQQLGCKVGSRAGTQKGFQVSEEGIAQAGLVLKKIISYTGERGSGARVGACWG